MEKLAQEDINKNVDEEKTSELPNFLEEVSALKTKVGKLIQKE